MLYDFVEDMTADGRALRFVVPPGSPTRHAIVLSDLDRIVTVTETREFAKLPGLSSPLWRLR